MSGRDSLVFFVATKAADKRENNPERRIVPPPTHLSLSLSLCLSFLFPFETNPLNEDFPLFFLHLFLSHFFSLFPMLDDESARESRTTIDILGPVNGFPEVSRIFGFSRACTHTHTHARARAHTPGSREGKGSIAPLKFLQFLLPPSR